MLLLSGARLADGRIADVVVADGVVRSVAPAGGPGAGVGGGGAADAGDGGPRPTERLDLRGYLLLPAPADPHTHLDEAFTAAEAEAEAGRSGPRRDAGPPPALRVVEAALTGLGYGSVVQRTFVPLDLPDADVRLRASLQAARELRNLMELQVVPLAPLVPLAQRSGPTGLTPREALDAGAHALGVLLPPERGMAGYAGVVERELTAALELAAGFGVGLDVHLPGSGSPRAADALVRALERLRPGGGPEPGPGRESGADARIGRSAGVGVVVAGLGPVGAELGARLAAAGVVVCGLPQGGGCVSSSGVRGRWHGREFAHGQAAGAGSAGGTAERFGRSGAAPTRGMPGAPGGPGAPGAVGAGAAEGMAGAERGPGTLASWRAAGLTLAAGSGGLRDRACPAGRADPLNTAYLLTALGGLSPADAYACVGSGARRALGLAPVPLEPGCPADLLAVRGGDLAEVLAAGQSRIVLRRGRVVSRTSAVREFADVTAGPPSPAPLPRQLRPTSGPGGR